MTFRLAASSLILPGLFLVWQSARLTWTIRARASGIDIGMISEHIVGNFSIAVCSLLMAVIALGLVLALRNVGRSAPSRTRMLRTAVGTLVVGVVAANLITILNLDRIRADTLLKRGAAFAEAGRTQLGLDMIERAAVLAPYEPLHLLQTGRVLMAAARNRSNNVDAQRTLLVEAEQVLTGARSLSPLDPDHTANIARCLVVQSTIADNPGARMELQRRAAAEYSETLRLRRTWPRVIAEYEALLRSMGENAKADKLTRKTKRPQ